MLGQMMDHPLLISDLLTFSAQYHGDTEIVTRTVEGPIHRYDYRSAARRSRQLAQALARLGIEVGDRVATMAWNTHRHFELYFGVSGMGAVCHTLNPRLFADQLTYIVNHAGDKAVFVDLTFVPLLEKLADQLQGVEHWVVMTDGEHMPDTSLPNALCYEDLVEAEDGNYDWPSFDENTASSLCYTSGTTGHPKGVLYSHRSTVLHSYAACMVDTLRLSARDSVLPVVPMFHANAWGLPYASPLVGAKQVLPGPGLDAPSLVELFEQEEVTTTAGVPTIWLGLLQHLRDTGKSLGTVRRVVIGGSAAPRSMIAEFQERHRVQVVHAWGMTETSPLGTVGTLKSKHEGLSEDARLDLQAKQGRAVAGVQLRIVSDDGAEQVQDGEAFGELEVKGPWVVGRYFRTEGEALRDGWFPTGDVATIDHDGFMQITDRAKDVIKSGGEWISSIDLENEVVAHPRVAEAAVIGIHHPKWDERPLLVVVAKPDDPPTAEELREFLQDKIAKWWMPDDIVFVDELPHTATGKISKKDLRVRFENYELPTA
ncbi:MAG: 3-(methylthio)propionyl-CoA ligase [Thermoanaerobaculia bacterium]|nr:3-(methylthio)propionyl-CoA ligase [Thermoanaerobaculia bacterium]